MAEIRAAAQRLAIYARVSTEEQREGQNIDSQIAELERFAREKAWLVAGVYKDDGWSGGVMERPELDRLRDDAQKGVFDAALINDVDRLARDVAHLGVIKRDLERKGVKVIFRKLPSDTSPTSNLMVNILGSFAEFERELIADRTRRGRRHKVEVRKQYLGSNTAYGYRYLPKNQLTGREGVLELAPEEASVVKRMFDWIDQEGLSAHGVLRRLNELRIPPKKGAARWGKSSVLRILHSEMYAGTWHYNKFQSCEPKDASAGPRYRKRSKCCLRQRPRNEWLPLELPESLRIVTIACWRRVQQQLSRNITFSPRNEKHAYLLKGLVVCGGCGARYVGDPCHGRFYYRCLARCKNQPTVRETALNDAVKQAVRRVILNPALILDPLRKLDKAAAAEQKRARDVGQATERELKRLAAEEERMLAAYRTAIITPAQLGQQLEKVNARRAALEVQLTELQTEPVIPTEQAEKAVTDYCAEAAQNLADFTDERWREFLRVIVEKVIFYGDHAKLIGRIPVDPANPNATANLKLELPLGS